MIFNKKKETPKPEPKPFVPQYYVYVEYGDKGAVRSQMFDTQEAAEVERLNIAHEAEAQDWVDVNTTMIRSQAIKSLSINKTMPRIPTVAVW